MPPDRIPFISRFQIMEAWIWRLEAWMLDAGRIGRIGGRWLLDGRRGCKDVSHAQRSRRSAD